MHRIGRTGRAGEKGTAITLFTRRDGKYARDLCKLLHDAGQQVPQQLDEMGRGGGGGRYGGGGGFRGGGRGRGRGGGGRRGGGGGGGRW